MRFLPFSALLIGAALFAAAPASAQVTSTANASSLRYTLGDLRPADGQAPGVSFASPAGSLYVAGSVSDASGRILYQENQSLVWPQDSSGELSWKDATRSSIALTAGGAIGIQGGSALASVAADTGQVRYSAAQNSWDTGFRLAPYSSLTLSLDIDVLARVVPDGSYNLYASSSAGLWGWGAFSDGVLDTQSGVDSGFALAYDNPTVSNPEAHEAKTLTITFVNPNDSWGDGHFTFNLGVSSQLQALSPVPEPQGRSLLAGGLLALSLGAVAARRRKKQAP